MCLLLLLLSCCCIVVVIAVLSYWLERFTSTDFLRLRLECIECEAISSPTPSPLPPPPTMCRSGRCNRFVILSARLRRQGDYFMRRMKRTRTVRTSTFRDWRAPWMTRPNRGQSACVYFPSIDCLSIALPTCIQTYILMYVCMYVCMYIHPFIFPSVPAFLIII